MNRLNEYQFSTGFLFLMFLVGIYFEQYELATFWFIGFVIVFIMFVKDSNKFGIEKKG